MAIYAAFFGLAMLMFCITFGFILSEPVPRRSVYYIISAWGVAYTLMLISFVVSIALSFKYYMVGSDRNEKT